MRKSMGVFIGLLVILISVLSVCFAAVNRTGEEVQIEEGVLYGDRSAVEGIELTVPVGMNAKLFWETAYIVGDRELPQTKVWLEPKGHFEYASTESHHFSLEMYSGGGSANSTGNLELEVYAPYGMEEIFAEVAGRTNAGESRTEQLRYRDYQEYYPYFVRMVIDGQECVNDDRDSRDEQSAVLGDIRIPIPEDCYVDVTIHKKEDGGVYGYDYNLIGGPQMDLNSFHVVTDEAMYYAVDAREWTQDGSERPVNGMDQWYGIYRMNYQYVQNGSYHVVEPDLEGISCVMELDVNTRILEMRISEDREKLLLFTADKGMCRLTVIDPDTFDAVQQLELFPYRTRMSSGEIVRKDGLLVWITNNDQMAVLTESEHGVYELQFTGELWTEEMKEEITGLRLSARRFAVDYDGEKLALLCPQPYYYREDRQREKGTCLFWLMVYDETGMLYLGEYGASQGIGEGYGSVFCNIRDDVKMGVSWGE